MYAKGKPDPNKEHSNNDRTTDWGGRGDTWTDHSVPLYDRNGNQVGTYNDPNKAWENYDRR